MPASPYIRNLRSHVGHALLLLPGVTAVIQNGDGFLLARQRDTGLWSLIGGGVEPGEDPRDAIEREVREELGVTPTVGRVIGAYGGPNLATTYPNGDEVSYVTTAYRCSLPSSEFKLEHNELIDVAWVERSAIDRLPRHEWIDRVLYDIQR